MLLEKSAISMPIEEGIKRWTSKRKAALVMEIIQGKTSISEASRAFDISPTDVEEWVDEVKRGMENALRAKPLEIKEQCVHRQRFETLQHAARVLGDWIGFYNQKRPHQALKMKPPKPSV